MQIDQVEWLRRENYFLREQNKKLKEELSETKKYLEEILIKFKEINLLFAGNPETNLCSYPSPNLILKLSCSTVSCVEYCGVMLGKVAIMLIILQRVFV